MNVETVIPLRDLTVEMGIERVENRTI
jgi:hypothetical protein